MVQVHRPRFFPFVAWVVEHSPTEGSVLQSLPRGRDFDVINPRLGLTKHKPNTKQTKHKEDRSSILFSLSSLLRRAGAGDDLIGGGGDISGRVFRVEGGDEQDAAVGADDHGLAKEI